MSRAVEIFRGLFKRYRKRGAIALGVIVAIELLAAAAVFIAGRELIDSRSAPASAQRGGTAWLGLNSSHATPSIAIF